jgi:hypothetical protein
LSTSSSRGRLVVLLGVQQRWHWRKVKVHGQQQF